MQKLSSPEESLPSDTLSGKRLVQLMRKHRWTIERLAYRLGTSQKRIRMARDNGQLTSTRFEIGLKCLRARIRGRCQVDSIFVIMLRRGVLLLRLPSLRWR